MCLSAGGREQEHVLPTSTRIFKEFLLLQCVFKCSRAGTKPTFFFARVQLAGSSSEISATKVHFLFKKKVFLEVSYLYNAHFERKIHFLSLPAKLLLIPFL